MIVNEAKKPMEKKIDYGERRERTKFPRFEQDTPGIAQQWLKHYEHLCGFMAFDNKEKVAELSVVLTGQALNWFLNVEKTDWSSVRTQFSLQFGGGNNPVLVAHAELKKLRQRKMLMKEFGPLIADLLDRAQIYRPAVQINYVKERISNELLRALIYRGPKTLVEASNITTEVEDDLKRLSHGVTSPIFPAVR